MKSGQERSIETVEVGCPVCGSEQAAAFARGIDFEYLSCDNEFTMLKCSRCSNLFLNPRPDPKDLKRIYPPNYIPYEFGKIKNPLVRWARNYVQKKKVIKVKKLVSKTSTILDVGCGSGALLKLLRRFGFQEWKLIGNDIDISAARRMGSEDIIFIEGRFEEAVDTIPQVDLVILNQTIEHLSSPDSTIKSISKVIKQGGYLLIETPSYEAWDAKLFKQRYWGGYHFPRHWTIFSLEGLVTLLSSYGFVLDQRMALASPSFWVQSVHHFIWENVSKTFADKFITYKNPLLMVFFTIVDLVQTAILRKTSNMHYLFKKANNI